MSNPYKEEILNKLIPESDVSPLKSVRVSQRNKLAYGKRKVVQIQGAVSYKVTKVLGVESNELPETTTCSKCEDMDRLLTLLKENMLISSNQKQM